MIPNIEKIASDMMAEGKGILAADESENTMNKRLAAINVPQTVENGRIFREILLTTPNIEEYISAVILFDATIRQSVSTGKSFTNLLESIGVIPGIKVDKGLDPFINFSEEKISRGLDDLDVRLKEYYELGARFTKWRSVIKISDTLPSDLVVRVNAQVLAQYAAIVQSNHMVPMVEPEVLFEGTHTLERSGEVLRKTLSVLFDELESFRVFLPGLILKTSMALPGKESGIPLVPFDVAKETVSVLKDTVPGDVGGVVFLSGGQTPLQATENLNAISQINNLPWPVTFSYSRALEEPVFEAWKGEEQNIEIAQEAFLHRLKMNVLARRGEYKKEME